MLQIENIEACAVTESTQAAVHYRNSCRLLSIPLLCDRSLSPDPVLAASLPPSKAEAWRWAAPTLILRIHPLRRRRALLPQKARYDSSHLRDRVKACTV